MSVTPPLGLAILAAVLEREGVEVQIVDAAARNLEDQEIVEAIEPGTSLIGIGSTTSEIDAVERLCGLFRRALPSARLILGGSHPTVFHESLVRTGVCDMVVRGEGEKALLLVSKGIPFREIPNLTWRAPSGEIVVNPQDHEFVDLDDLPIPAFHKLPMDLYRSALGAAKNFPSLGLITSRGCPGSCNFCFSKMHGPRTRFLSASGIVTQVRHLHFRYGIREFSFYDDTFTTDRKRVENLCNLLLQEGLRVSWSCFARVDTIEPRLLKLMNRAGCHQIMFGFECSDPEILKAMNKSISVEKAKCAANWAKEAGLDVRGAFMIGNPGETFSGMRKTIDYSLQLGIPLAIFNVTTPFPGTVLFDWAERNGFLKNPRWQEFDLAHPVMDLPGLPGKAIRAAYRMAYRRFYLRPRQLMKGIEILLPWIIERFKPGWMRD